jgi:hypothetical protein
VSAVRLCVGPLSLCLLYAFAGIQTAVSQSITSLTLTCACENPLRSAISTGDVHHWHIYTLAYSMHLLYYKSQFIVICATYLCCMEMRVCKLLPGQIEAVYSKTACSFLHGIARVDVNHIMPILTNAPVSPPPARFQHV